MSEHTDDPSPVGHTYAAVTPWTPRANAAPTTWPENGFDWMGGELLTAIGRGARELEGMRAFLRSEGHAVGREDDMRCSLARLVAADLLARGPDGWSLRSEAARVLEQTDDEVHAQRRAFYRCLRLR
jgi:hypothetical protein